MKLFLAKQIINGIAKGVKRNREKKELETLRNVDVQIKQILKEQAKQGKTIEKNEVDIAKLKSDSHPKREFIVCNNCNSKIKEKEC